MLIMKLVRENINEFKRGIDPRRAMNIGLSPNDIIKLKQKIPILQRPSPYLGKNNYNNKEYSRGYLLWKLLKFIKQGEDTGGRRYKDLVIFYYKTTYSKKTLSMGVFNSINKYTEYTPERGYKRMRVNNRYFLNRNGEEFLEKYNDAFSKQIKD